MHVRHHAQYEEKVHLYHVLEEVGELLAETSRLPDQVLVACFHIVILLFFIYFPLNSGFRILILLFLGKIVVVGFLLQSYVLLQSSDEYIDLIELLFLRLAIVKVLSDFIRVRIRKIEVIGNFWIAQLIQSCQY